MKNGLSLILAFNLIGCSTIFTPIYDPNEYDYFVKMYVQTHKTIPTCVNRTELSIELDKLIDLSNHTFIYTKFEENNEDGHELAMEIHQMIKELYLRVGSEVGVSDVYCEQKLLNIQQSIQIGLEGIGKKVK